MFSDQDLAVDNNSNAIDYGNTYKFISRPQQTPASIIIVQKYYNNTTFCNCIEKGSFFATMSVLAASVLPLRVALYLRVSTKDSRQDSDNQRMQLQALCDLIGCQVVGTYINNESGRKEYARAGRLQPFICRCRPTTV